MKRVRQSTTLGAETPAPLLQRIAEMISYNTDRIFNLSPRKGTPQVGSDADVAIVDGNREMQWRGRGMSSESCACRPRALSDPRHLDDVPST